MSFRRQLQREYNTGDTVLITGVFVTVRELFSFGFQTDWLIWGHDFPNVGFKAPYGLAKRRIAQRERHQS